MNIEDLMLFGVMGLLLYLVLRGQQTSPLLQTSLPVYGLHVGSAPAPTIGYQCPSGQFWAGTGPMGMGPMACTDVLS
jgi:hypothetical protein